MQATVDNNNKSKTIFGEALAFYQLKVNDITEKSMVLYYELMNLKQPLGQLRGQWYHNTIHTIDVSAIVDIVGIWDSENENRDIYILRKHPAISLLNAEDVGKDSEVDGEEDFELEKAGGDSDGV